MAQHLNYLIDWLLIRARIEPGHERPLRVFVKHPDDPSGEPVPEEAFADADAAANFVRGWLQTFVRRWEAGERTPLRRWGAEDDDAALGECEE